MIKYVNCHLKFSKIFLCFDNIMKHRFLLTLCCVFFFTEEARSENEYDVKRGVFPFMAILYYPDEAVVDVDGNRFLHAAVLIKPEWLLSAAIDHSVLDNVPLGFPRKTLLARMGALTLDANFAFNEDEDEQEREVIQIIKPSNHSKETWWATDITLLQTLLPFKLSSAIAPTTINPKRTYVDKNCVILVYTKKYGSRTGVKFLMQLAVELLPASTENCGPNFFPPTMTCATHDPSEDMKKTYDPDFCSGNSGGPLLCEGEVMALQTYVDNNCIHPHLYQLLAPWDTFINCAIAQKCNVEPDCNICTVIRKDESSPNNITQTDTVNTGEAYSRPSITPENSINENTTSSEISLQQPMRTKPPALDINSSTVSDSMTSAVSYDSQTLVSEENLSATTEKNEYSSPMRSGTLPSNYTETSGLEQSESPSRNKDGTSPSNTTESVTERPAQRRISDDRNEDDNFLDFFHKAKQTLNSAENTTEKVHEIGLKSDENQEKPLTELSSDKDVSHSPINNQTKLASNNESINNLRSKGNEINISHHQEHVKYPPKVKSTNDHVQDFNEYSRERKPQALARRDSLTIVSGKKVRSRNGAGNRKIINPLILPLTIVIFIIKFLLFI